MKAMSANTLVSFDQVSYNGSVTLVDVIDILRALSRRDSTSVMGYSWQISSWEFFGYGFSGTIETAWQFLFQSLRAASLTPIVISGKDLFKASSLVHQTEECLLSRIAKPKAGATVVKAPKRLLTGQARFLAHKSDLELRCSEGQWEIVTSDVEQADYLAKCFSNSQGN